ncbi:21 kDa protein-like [Impatiens glandulifera]|uniref:21 kDa protein-like n=1 Tax=Impatiens glandulifera TaxID=253017 RepID=UPI001FB13860|nr:21 kDa protein-like [Impatiens glandulifera]
MAKNIIIFMIFFTLLYAAGTANSSAATTTTTTTTTSFIRASCEVTTYKAVCVQSLVGYASAIQRSQRQLAHTALAVSLERAQASRTLMSKMTKLRGLKPMEHQAIRDCMEEMGDSVDRIRQSVQELKITLIMAQEGKKKNKKELLWHLSNVQTWVSTALTDESTCMDGVSDRGFNPRIKAEIRNRVTNLAQVTSNALALINHFSTLL